MVNAVLKQDPNAASNTRCGAGYPRHILLQSSTATSSAETPATTPYANHATWLATSACTIRIILGAAAHHFSESARHTTFAVEFKPLEVNGFAILIDVNRRDGAASRIVKYCDIGGSQLIARRIKFQLACHYRPITRCHAEHEQRAE
jgi:hypothetical protein